MTELKDVVEAMQAGPRSGRTPDSGQDPGQATMHKSLVAKLCEVVAATERVPKNGWNDFHKYAFARESDIVEAIRGELAARHVFIFPTVASHERKEHTTEKGRKTFLTDIIVNWMFVDGDSAETFTVSIPGCGEDSGDKGFYKAFTGSEKYMLTKSFLIPTGDDPENDDGKPGPQPDRAAAQSPLNMQQQTSQVPHPGMSAMAQPNASSGETTHKGRVGQVTGSTDGKCWFLSIGDIGTKGNGTIWTRDEELANSLVKSQGMNIQARMRSKTPGKYQILSFIPEENQ